LAGGIAHDFNNLLTVILGRCGIVTRKLPTGDALGRDLELIQKTAEKAASLTRQLLAFSRKQVLQPKIINLNDVLSNLDKMLKSMVGENVELAILPGAGLGSIKADPGQVEQVVMNLVVNAKEAMPQGGHLVLETKNVHLQQDYLGKQFRLPPDDYVVLKVSDSGEGMDADTLPHIFEPFFTTKEKGKGTGLGLATVYGIVKQSGGYIEAESNIGKGSVFTVYLPRVEEQKMDLIPETSQLKVGPGRETILLVEDEPAVRELIRDYLTQSGYAVLEAAGASEALRKFQDNQSQVELIVTDVVMPRMSGPALVARIKNLNPEIQVLYISGYTDEMVLQQGLLRSQVDFLQKPFSEKTLLKKTREILDRSRSKPQPKSS
jgi:CheY-like chemotaxis protein